MMLSELIRDLRLFETPTSCIFAINKARAYGCSYPTMNKHP